MCYLLGHIGFNKIPGLILNLFTGRKMAPNLTHQENKSLIPLLSQNIPFGTYTLESMCTPLPPSTPHRHVGQYLIFT